MKVRVVYDVSPWAASTIFKHRTLMWVSAMVAAWLTVFFAWWVVIPLTVFGLVRLWQGQMLVYRAGPLVPPVTPTESETDDE
jgi:hypothetical protein